LVWPAPCVAPERATRNTSRLARISPPHRHRSCSPSSGQGASKEGGGGAPLSAVRGSQHGHLGRAVCRFWCSCRGAEGPRHCGKLALLRRSSVVVVLLVLPPGSGHGWTVPVVDWSGPSPVAAGGIWQSWRCREVASSWWWSFEGVRWPHW
jgi:hypothetical protein